MGLGKVRVLAILFDSLNDNNLPAFSGGDLVSGRVVVEVTGMALATSFEGKHGSVRYWVKAELHRPWLLPGQSEERVHRVRTHRHQHAAAAVSSGRVQGEDALLLVLCFRSHLPQCQDREEGLHSRRVHPDLLRGGEQLVPGGGAQGGALPDADLLRQGEGEADPAAGVQPEGRDPAAGQEPELGGQAAEDPPRSPSILDCPIIRVEYVLVVYVDVPGGLNLSLSLPLVIGTIPLHASTSRSSSISSCCSWGPTETPEVANFSPFAFLADVSEQHTANTLDPCDIRVDPYPDPVEVRRPETCPSR
ncbi:Arrestin domain containing protein 3 [Dissostichus eleginoides]|uniref:Arrestin domain-containing protein 3 n=1 Tax=Dissostichus eleginoides TaxID=100907 RepID=A0AAD9BKI8_DISEL|nr:Arrestin domain containing protein 3 [Dissostichus eleginoides]